MADALILPAKVSYTGGDADNHILDFYDGTQSLFGFAKAIKLSTHYLINNDVTFHATATRGVRIVMLPSRSGSWEQVIKIIIENPEATIAGVVLSIGSNAVWDFTKYIFGKATGRYFVPTNRVVNKVIQNEGDIDALIEAIDNPLLEAHRTVAGKRENAVGLIGQRTELISFNNASYEYLKTRIVSEDAEERNVSIASFNVNSGSGRLYDYAFGRTVPFEPEKGAQYDSSSLTWSLDRRNRNLDGTIAVSVRRITTVDGEIKKFLLSDCRKLP